ncbi:hypothetical protein LCGC14_2112210 [marine sediment metagenome]|uniref:Uncharacterized protein n=1 Tax=marine sediment metagenome TaxID=412755 RepID=A0A0F9E6Q0_9ZZZZ
MKNKFFKVYFLFTVSTISYIIICAITTRTPEEFYLFLSFGLMVSMFIFCCILTTLSDRDD